MLLQLSSYDKGMSTSNYHCKCIVVLQCCFCTLKDIMGSPYDKMQTWKRSIHCCSSCPLGHDGVMFTVWLMLTGWCPFYCCVCRCQDDYFYSKRPVSPLSPPSGILELSKPPVKAQHAEKYHTPPEKGKDSTAQKTQVLKIMLFFLSFSFFFSVSCLQRAI